MSVKLLSCNAFVKLFYRYLLYVRPCGVGGQTGSSAIAGKLSLTSLSSVEAALFTVKIMKSFHPYCYKKEEEKIFKCVQDRG